MALEHDQLRPLIDAFYARIRADAQLGPIFEAHVADWDEHSSRLTDFWSSLMLTSGRYKGNPFMQHVPFAEQLDAALFERWLAIWADTTSEMFPAEIAAVFQLKARKVAESLKAGLLGRPGLQARRHTA